MAKKTESSGANRATAVVCYGYMQILGSPVMKRHRPHEKVPSGGVTRAKFPSGTCLWKFAIWTLASLALATRSQG